MRVGLQHAAVGAVVELVAVQQQAALLLRVELCAEMTVAQSMAIYGYLPVRNRC